MAFSIPIQDQMSIVELFELNQSERGQLIEVLRDSKPLMVMKDFEEQFVKRSSLPEDQARRILRVLVNLYSVMDYLGESSNTITRELIESLSTIDSDTVRHAKATDITDFQDFLQTLLSFSESLGVSAKVLRVMSQHEHLFLHSELYTDLRPIFGMGEVDLQPVAAVLIHALKIEYRKDLAEKTIYISLDYNDLIELQGTIERAIKKHQSLIKSFGDSIHILSSK